MDADALCAWGPCLLAAGAILSLAWGLPRRSAVARAGCAAVAAACALRYGAWRLGTLPPDQGWAQHAWACVFLAVEEAGLLSGLVTALIMSRTVDRSAEADAAQDSPLLSAPTDVFIVTYNEPREVLERTVVGALAIDHPDLRVWVLDDGARPWAEALARETGALYVSRTKGLHAKAGNINNGLAHALREGRRPEFVLILDADFVASRHILRRALALFGPADVGCVQTPQHFFNPDPVLLNLACTHVCPDEQRFFFNALMPCLDAWGVAFCCGTSVVMRVAALEAVGGIATETVTEDMLTSFKMGARGWRTVFLNERLSFGLAPEGLAEFVTQRGRWCLGAIQQLHTRYAFFGRGPMGLRYRLSCFNTVLHWTAGPPLRLAILACPAVYWLTGASVIAASGAELVAELLPHVVASVLFVLVYGRGTLIPVMSDVTQLVPAVAVMSNVAIGLVRPWGRGFRVTPKGVSRAGVVARWGLMWPFLALAAATGAGLAMNATPGGARFGGEGYALNVVWSLLDGVTLLLVCVACIESPQRRTDQRFMSGEPGVLAWPGGRSTPCVLADISLTGAQVEPLGRVEQPTHGAPPTHGTLLLDDARLRLPFRVRRKLGENLAVQFEIGSDLRRALIRRLYDGLYVREVEDRSAARVWLGMLRSLLA